MFNKNWKQPNKVLSIRKRGTPRLYIKPTFFFNLFISNIPYSFENTLSDPFVLPNGTKLNSVLYADDFQYCQDLKQGCKVVLIDYLSTAIPGC